MKLPNKFIRNFCRIVTFFLKNGLAPGIKEPLHATASMYKFIFWACVVCTQWRRPGAQFGGTDTFFLKNGLAPGIKEPLHATASMYKFIFWACVVCTQWRRPGAQFGGTETFLADQNF